MSECVKNVVSWVSQVGDKVGKGTSALIDALPSLKEDHHVVMVRLFCSCLHYTKNYQLFVYNLFTCYTLGRFRFRWKIHSTLQTQIRSVCQYSSNHRIQL